MTESLQKAVNCVTIGACGPSAACGSDRQRGMEGTMATNFDRLKQADLIEKRNLPPHYQKVVDELSETEMNVLVGVKQKLDAASATTGKPRHDAKTYIFI
jgi:hypothetical protein